MTPLQITLIIILVLIFVIGIITYFIRGKYYDQIDQLDQEKKELLNKAPHEELKEVKELSLAGQSSELRDEFENQWKQIESSEYPKLENYLFEAEQATDRYRLNEAKKSQEKAQELMSNLNNEIKELTESLEKLIEREQANLKKIDEIKKRYHEVRKSLLAYSFSFGPASETFEENLNIMEEDFTKFSEYTLSGDHEEANKIIKDLSDSIQITEEKMDQIPPLLEKVNEDYQKDIEDLYEAYQQMIDYDYLFPEDNILEDIDELKEQRQEALENIRLLKIKETEDLMDQMDEKIRYLYERMEVEIESERKIYSLVEDVKEAINFLRDEVRRYSTLEQRLEQSYILLHNESKSLETMQREINDAIEEYQVIFDKINEKELAYSIAYSRLDYLFKNLDKLNNEKNKIAENLKSYRIKELEFKNEMQAMEEAMYDMKRALESERLPGLPDNYLELFFSATDRIEKLADELSRAKVSLTNIRKLHEIAEEDVIQLSRMTEEIIDQVRLIERTSQRLYHFKDEHKGILETIRYSESLFKDDYDYNTSLRLLREKLNNIAPEAYEKIVDEYEEDKSNDLF